TATIRRNRNRAGHGVRSTAGMPRVLIAGCGYLGQAVADLFLAANWQVEGWTQSAKSAAECFSGRYPVYGVDISDSKQVAAQEGEFSMVVHCASTHGGDADLYRRIYLDGARNLIDRFAGSALLFTSSTSVYAQNAGEWVTEKSLAQPKHETGKILRKAEEVVLAAGGVIARLAGLYGPGRSFLLKRFLSGA